MAAMGLSARDLRALAGIEHRLCEGDPELARLFDAFTRMSRERQMPPALRPRPARPWQLAVLLVALIVATGLITALSSGLAHAACVWNPLAANAPAQARAGSSASARCVPLQHRPAHMNPH
jgi:hypothetical protein